MRDRGTLRRESIDDDSPHPPAPFAPRPFEPGAGNPDSPTTTPGQATPDAASARFGHDFSKFRIFADDQAGDTALGTGAIPPDTAAPPLPPPPAPAGPPPSPEPKEKDSGGGWNTEDFYGTKKILGEKWGGVVDGAGGLAWDVAGLVPGKSLITGGASTAIDLAKSGVSYGKAKWLDDPGSKQQKDDEKEGNRYLHDAPVDALGMIPGFGLGKRLSKYAGKIAKMPYVQKLEGEIAESHLGGKIVEGGRYAIDHLDKGIETTFDSLGKANLAYDSLATVSRYEGISKMPLAGDVANQYVGSHLLPDVGSHLSPDPPIDQPAPKSQRITSDFQHLPQMPPQKPSAPGADGEAIEQAFAAPRRPGPATDSPIPVHENGPDASAPAPPQTNALGYCAMHTNDPESADQCFDKLTFPQK